MKTILSHILYYIGDIIARLFLRYDFLAWFLYKPYNILMILSCNLDKDRKVWKSVYKVI